METSLVSRNIRIDGHRTSVRLEPCLWEALEEICARESVPMHSLCGRIARRKHKGGFTSALRVYIVNYLRHTNVGDNVRPPPAQLGAHELM